MNKKSSYIIIPVFLIIWGLVAYRIYTQFFQDTNNGTSRPNLYLKQQSDKDTFSLYLNYNDPFLFGRNYKDNANNSFMQFTSVTVSPAAIAAAPLEEKEIPPFQFHGLVKKGRSQIGLFKTGQNVALLSINDTISGFSITSLTDDMAGLKSIKSKKTYNLPKYEK